eukprot:2035583-Amphidinium_carterae.1
MVTTETPSWRNHHINNKGGVEVEPHSATLCDGRYTSQKPDQTKPCILVYGHSFICSCPIIGDATGSLICDAMQFWAHHLPEHMQSLCLAVGHGGKRRVKLYDVEKSLHRLYKTTADNSDILLRIMGGGGANES